MGSEMCIRDRSTKFFSIIKRKIVDTTDKKGKQSEIEVKNSYMEFKVSSSVLNRTTEK